MGADTPNRLAERLAAEGARVESFFRELPTERLDATVYSEGAHWTVQQVLVHLALSEDSMKRLVENIIQGGPGSPADFDLNGYNERKVASISSTNFEDLIDLYHRSRQATVALVRSLGEADLELQGRHPFLGVTSLVEIIKMFYLHNQIHLREIRRAFNPPGAGQERE